MCSKKVIATDKAPAAIGPYSQGVEFCRLVFVSGQLPIDAETGNMADTYAEQTRQSLENVRAILEEAGSSLDKVLKVTVFLKDMAMFSEMNEVYAEFFRENPPARCAVEVSELPKGALVEIEAIAHK
jgi:2-iminobutanoate/2-iminopropanoate deaminase